GMLPLLTSHLEAARRDLPPEVLAFIEAGGVSTAEAAAAWADLRLVPRVLRDVSDVDTSLTLLGVPLRTPVLVAPTAFHGRVHPLGEAATSAGAAAAGSMMVVATRADRPVTEVTPPFWWQSYVL